MKKIIVILVLVFGIYTTTTAQTKSAPANSTVSKNDKATIAAQKKADKEAKALAKKQAKEQAKAASANATASTDKATIAAQKKADKEAKALAKKQAKEQAKATQVQTPANPSTTSTTSPASTASIAKVKKQSSVVNQPNTSHPEDKAISTDAKGRTIYQGPRGGKYYINKNGNKEYVK